MTKALSAAIQFKLLYYISFRPPIKTSSIFQLCFSERQSSKIPAIVLTSKSVQTFSPAPAGSLRFILPQIDMVMGKHQASGIIRKPCATQPKSKIFYQRLLNRNRYYVPRPYFIYNTAPTFYTNYSFFVNLSSAMLTIPHAHLSLS